MDKMLKKIATMSNDDLLAVWESLGRVDCSPDEYYDRECGLTMSDWLCAIYTEMFARKI